MSNRKMIDDARKVGATIASCLTTPQLLTAERMYINLCRKYNFSLPEHVMAVLASEFKLVQTTIAIKESKNVQEFAPNKTRTEPS